MTFPILELSRFPREASEVRTFLSSLSGVQAIGVVEALAGETSVLLRAHANRRVFTIINTANDTTIFEAIGPRTIRLWQVDDADDVKNVAEAMKFYIGEHVAGLERLQYRYTVNESVVWRPRLNGYLPRIKRRVFSGENSSAFVLHSKQTDQTDRSELHTYILQTTAATWRFSYVIVVNAAGTLDPQVVEPLCSTTTIGF